MAARGGKAGGKKAPRSRVQSGPLRQTVLSVERSSKKGASGGKAGAGLAEAEGEGAAAAKLVYEEVKGDLFGCAESVSLAHCVSEDMAMGKGIATLFKEKFKSVGELKSQGVKTGGVAILEREGRFIYYLVTKPRSFHKPRYESLQSSLTAMMTHCQAHAVKHLAMPKIGCGLDQLSWGRVSKMIQATFRDLEMNITVYCL